MSAKCLAVPHCTIKCRAPVPHSDNMACALCLCPCWFTCCFSAHFVLSVNELLSPFSSQTVWLQPLQLCCGMSLMRGCKMHPHSHTHTHTHPHTHTPQFCSCKQIGKQGFPCCWEHNFRGSLTFEKGYSLNSFTKVFKFARRQIK